MKKCRCKCRRAGGERAMLAPTAKGNRDVQTVKECQDWLISEYDLEVKRLTAERDKAIAELEVALEMLDTFMKVLNMIVGKETENG